LAFGVEFETVGVVSDGEAVKWVGCGNIKVG